MVYNTIMDRNTKKSSQSNTNQEPSTYYVTTPIYYSNDVPHMGHTGTTIFADIIARFKRSVGEKVLLTTGNDEHGEKVYTSALSKSQNVQEYLDDMAKEWKKYWDELNVSYDYFVRTTDPKHKKVVQDLLSKLYEKGDIYKGTYKGVYCIGCEEYKTERQLVNGYCPEHRPDQIVIKEEETYFFKLSKYSPIVKEKIEKNEIIIAPENKRQEILARLNEEVKDLSTSRENGEWGIEIPWDKKHRIYVWVDALINYYSSVVILNKEEFWPPDVHVVGKGINWFHSVIWPAMLIALNIETPRKVFVHSHYNVEGSKMSKSLGNVISPQALIDRYGIDGTRYLLAASMPYDDDADVSFDYFDEKYNSDLANGLGNLVSRVAKLAENLDIGFEEGILEESKEKHEANNTKFVSKIVSNYEDYKLNGVINCIKEYIDDCNLELNKKAPWANDNTADAKRDVKTIIVSILIISAFLEPIIPETAKKIREIFVTEKIKSTIPLFKRI